MRAFFLVGLIAVVACGGTDANPLGDGGGDGTTVSDSSGGDGSSSGDSATDGSAGNEAGGDAATDGSGDATSGDAGPCSTTWASCNTCLTSSCSTQLTTCSMSASCKNGFVALAACESMCGNGCDNTFENAGGQAAKNLLDCGKQNCNVCPF